MDTVWQELIKALPWGFVLLAMRFLEIKDQKEQRIERASNAAEKAKVERDFDLEKNKLWMETIKNSMDGYKEIVSALEMMKKDLIDKYESMGITKDLLDAARRELSKQRKEQ